MAYLNLLHLILELKSISKNYLTLYPVNNNFGIRQIVSSMLEKLQQSAINQVFLKTVFESLLGLLLILLFDWINGTNKFCYLLI